MHRVPGLSGETTDSSPSPSTLFSHPLHLSWDPGSQPWMRSAAHSPCALPQTPHCGWPSKGVSVGGHFLQGREAAPCCRKGTRLKTHTTPQGRRLSSAFVYLWGFWFVSKSRKNTQHGTPPSPGPFGFRYCRELYFSPAQTFAPLPPVLFMLFWFPFVMFWQPKPNVRQSEASCADL